MTTTNPSLKIGGKTFSQIKCKSNFTYWMESLNSFDKTNPEFGEILSLAERILPAHTFAYKYIHPETGKVFNPLKSIFEYNDKTGEFSSKSYGLKAKAFRGNMPIPDLHMKTSVNMGHDIFLFAYHGVHNPFHREKDDPPIRPFGLFIKKEGTEIFPYSHGAPCDVATENELVDRSNLDKYYLLPDDLRTFKGHQIGSLGGLADFWYYFGNPDIWRSEDLYGSKIYQNAGEFRYYKQIKPESVMAILWPFFTDLATPDGNVLMDDNLELFKAFGDTFPQINLITYGHDLDDNYEWSVNLVEASFYSTKYYLQYGRFPKDADLAKNEILGL